MYMFNYIFYIAILLHVLCIESPIGGSLYCDTVCRLVCQLVCTYHPVIEFLIPVTSVINRDICYTFFSNVNKWWEIWILLDICFVIAQFFFKNKSHPQSPVLVIGIIGRVIFLPKFVAASLLCLVEYAWKQDPPLDMENLDWFLVNSAAW